MLKLLHLKKVFLRLLSITRWTPIASFEIALASYRFIYLEADNQTIQTILPNRLKQTIFNYFMRFSASVRNLVRTVSCDLNSYCVDLIKKLFPNTKIIINRFHIIQMLNAEQLVNQELQLAN